MTTLCRIFAPGSDVNTDRQRLSGRALLASASVLLVGGALAAPTQAAFSDFGIESASGSLSTAQAGGHPDFTTVVTIKTDPVSPPDGDGDLEPWARTRDVLVDLPPGLGGNPTAVPRCTAIQFSTEYSASGGGGGGCPNASQVGISFVRVYGVDISFTQPVFNLQPPEGTVARLGFYVLSVPTMIDVEVRPERDYAVSASVEGVFALQSLVHATTTLWGVPADPIHDTQRQTPQEADSGGSISPPRPPGVAPAAFMLNPTSCGGLLEVGFAADSYQDLGNFVGASASMAPITGCERLDFSPEIELRPTTRRADWPSGMDVTLSLPQQTITEPGGLAEAHLKKSVVTLPEGMALNPSAADGLAGCSTAQIGLISKAPIRFNGADPACPDGSKVGTALVRTPLLPDPLEGSLYVADPDDNAFDTLLSGYLVAKGQGVLLKIAGRFDPDPRTGRIVATFDNNPQQPFDDVVLHFKGGDHGVVATPPSCGVFGVRSVFTSWAAPPDRPDQDEVRDGSFSFDQGCGERPFAFDFGAGTAAAVAGASSPFGMTVSREGGTQRFKGVKVTLPPGLLAKIRGVPQCPEPQAAAGTCGAESQIGSVRAAAGAGNTPVWIPQPGKAPTRVYLAGPYKGAPFSLSVVVPAQAGPFDLGDVVVRVALFVDPVDAHVTAVSDELPHILKGIPLNVRTMHVAADRAGFMRNPTACSPLSVGGELSSLEGSTKAASSRFQVGDCAGLRYRPRFRIRLTGSGQTRDGGHPGIVATASQRPGEAGIEQVKVALPLSLALDPDNAQGLCEYEDGLRLACPASSIIGRAEAVSPLLNEPLTGPVYFVKNVRIHPRTGRRIRTLPALLVTLTGENGVKINLRASSDVDDKARLVSSFSGLPDAPVSSFRMQLKGGKGGIIVVTHNKDVCRGKQIALAETDGHNGKRHDPKIKLATPCAQVGKPKPRGRTLRLPVRVPQAGTLSAGGGKSGLAKTTRRLAKAGKVTLTLKPTRAGLRRLARQGSMRLRVPVRFVPRGTKTAQRTSSPTVTMRR